MSPILKGFKKVVAVAEESTWGVKATTGWKFIEFRTEGLLKNVPEIIPAGIRGGVAGYIRRQSGPIDISGPIETDLSPEGGIPLLIKAAMGQVTSAQQGGTSCYKHTFSLVDNISFGETAGITCRLDRDIRVLDFYGLVVNVMTVTSASGTTPAGITFEFVGKNQDTGSSPSPTYPTVNPFLHQGQAQFLIDSVATDIQNWTFSLNNNYKTDVYGGSTERQKIPRGGFREVTGSVNLPVIEDFGIYDKFIAGTSATLTVTYTGAAIEGAYSYSIVITIPKIYYTGPTAPGSGAAETPSMDVPFRAIATSASTLEFTIDIYSEDLAI